MKKIFKYNFLFAAAAVGLLASCDQEDDSTHVQGYKPTMHIANTEFSVTEGEDVTINLSTKTPFYKSMEMKLELVGGTATFRDYTADTDGDPATSEETGVDDGMGAIGHRVSFPAYASDYSFTITPIIDMLPEGAETMKLRLYSAGNSNGLIDEVITINVADFVSNDVAIELNWSQTSADAHGTLHDATYLATDGKQYPYSDADFDMYILPKESETNPNTDITGFQGASSNTPEQALILDADTADGDYVIIADYYNKGPLPTGVSVAKKFQYKIDLKVAKLGVWYHSIPVTTFFSDTPISGPNGFGPNRKKVAILTKAGTTYTLKDYTTGEVFVSGRMAR